MMIPDRPKLSVIVASNRPKWLFSCLHQFARCELKWQREHGGRTLELVVVCEGHEVAFRRVEDWYFGSPKFHYKDEQGKAGAYAKDVGIQKASGEYLAFMDDDNVYNDEALVTLYTSVMEGTLRDWEKAPEGPFDIGVVQTKVMALDFKDVGRSFDFGEIDSMCLCVRRELALKERWADHEGPGTDHAWVQKLLAHGPTVNFRPVGIGIHL